MVPTGNKAKRLSSVNHTTKTIHHHHHHHPAPKIKHALLCSNLTCSTFQNTYFAKFPCWRPPWFSTSSFCTQNTIFVFHNIWKIIITQKFDSHHHKPYKFHALMNRNKEKTLQWSYNAMASKLQFDSFKLPN